ncbi:MAG: NADH dehydrogenase ubiquinone Fe-S protein 4 [Rickettsiaceae bacterium]|nr:NADH dehydrogenase ubiquinone Fe-S protein 4 [Rickettsiaceae bacterium]
MRARIIQHPKLSMQNAPFVNEEWFVEIEPHPHASLKDKIMGWTGSDDPNTQLRINFPNLDAALRYAESEHLEYEVIYSHKKKMTKKSYAENFK